MKIIFQAPPALAKTASELFQRPTPHPGGVFFMPLSAPGLYEDRIDITVTSQHGTRSYAFRRADELVN